MAPSLLRYLALAMMLCVAACCLAQSVTIRVIDIANQSPVANEPVTVAFYYNHSDAAADYSGEQEFTTDAKGEVLVTLPQPPPDHITVQIIPDYDKWICACVAVFSTRQLLEKGIVEAPPDKHNRVPAIAAKPGEVIFAVRQTSRWLRPFHFLYRD